MPIATGTRFGPYEILAPLAAGGMGEVYRARDTRLGREVALKILPAEFAADSSRRQRFEQEARAASALNHPNILTIFDVGNEGGVSFIVSELVDGDSLRALIRKGPAPLRKLLDIGAQVTDGLAAAHQAAIVHRDLKPENIMLTRDGRVKILDFGLAKQVVPAAAAGDDTVTVAQTQAGVILGTVTYMSPEQARGETVDFHSDQFSFGLILYELLTAKKAFQRDTTPETLTAILREEPQVANTPMASAPAPLRWTIERCLAKDPSDRYAATTDLFRDMRSLLSPDGQRIAYSRFGTSLGRNGAIWISAVAGGPPIRALEEAEDNPQQFPSWSPDGNSIVFISSRSGTVALEKAAVGGNARPVILKERVTGSPKWSPKGDWILYGMPDAIALLSGDGKTDRVLTKRRWYAHAWSKDGSLVYAMRAEQRRWTLASIAVPDGTEKTLSEFELPVGQSFGFARGFSLAPDGGSVTTSLNHFKSDIWLIEGFRRP